MDVKKIEIIDISKVEITDENFHEYFFDIRHHGPEHGDTLACFTAMADFVDSAEKRQIISLLKDYCKAHATAQVMRKLLHATELDAFRVPLEMTEDLLAGMSDEEVAVKPYRYQIQIYYYTKPEYVPKNNPHWSIISLINLNKHLDAIKQKRENDNTEV